MKQAIETKVIMKNKYAELLSKVNDSQRGVSDSILLCDGLNTFLRSFTMINHINTEGVHIGGLTGFMKSIGYAIKMLEPTKVVIIFDGSGSSNSKRNLYPEYKANRHISRMTNYSLFISKEEEDEAINNQMARLIQYLKVLPLSIICIDGIEADDVIGYLTGKLELYEPTKEVIIMSTDKDFLQLVSNKTKIYSPTKKKIYSPKDVMEEYGVDSNNFINYKILMGDSGDNIPGIRGLGPKKINKLFPNLSSSNKLTLQDIFNECHLNLDKHALYQNILERKQQLCINEQLMDLKNIPISEANIRQIQEGFNTTYSLNKHTFMSMYVNDSLGESIPNTNQWINNIFGSLEFGF